MGKKNEMGYKERCVDCGKKRLLVYGSGLCAKCWIKRTEK